MNKMPHSCCDCVSLLNETLKKRKREVQKLTRDLKTAKSRIERLKTQRKKLIEGNKKKAQPKKLVTTFFK